LGITNSGDSRLHRVVGKIDDYFEGFSHKGSDDVTVQDVREFVEGEIGLARVP
jgi:hypothetical protein